MKRLFEHGAFMITKPLPTREEILKLFEYNPETGKFIWKQVPEKGNRWNGRHAGRPAFTNRNQDGYLTSNFATESRPVATSYLAHRIAWLILTGEAPRDCIDHINGDRADNRAENIREATREQNKLNRIKPRPGKRFRGVHRHTQNGRWIAQVSKDGKAKHVGSFATEEEAARARDIAALEVRGEFAHLNFPELRHQFALSK